MEEEIVNKSNTENQDSPVGNWKKQLYYLLPGILIFLLVKYEFFDWRLRSFLMFTLVILPGYFFFKSTPKEDGLRKYSWRYVVGIIGFGLFFLSLYLEGYIDGAFIYGFYALVATAGYLVVSQFFMDRDTLKIEMKYHESLPDYTKADLSKRKRKVILAILYITGGGFLVVALLSLFKMFIN